MKESEIPFREFSKGIEPSQIHGIQRELPTIYLNTYSKYPIGGIAPSWSLADRAPRADSVVVWAAGAKADAEAAMINPRMARMVSNR